MKKRLIGFKSQYLIFLGLIFIVVVMVNMGNSSAANTTNLTDHNNNGIIKASSSYNSDPINNRTKESFKSINDAVNSKNTINGDTIIVGTGNYIENVNIDKKIVLMAFKNANITTKNPDLPIFTISIYGSGTIIKGFNFISNNPRISNAILLNSTKNCNVLQNNFTNIVGVSINIINSWNNTISCNTFKVTASNPTNLIHAIDSENNTISSNYMKIMGPINGVELQNSNSNHVMANTISGSGTSGCGIQVTESDNNQIKNNVINTLFSGVNLVSSLNTSVLNNNISKMSEDGIHLINCFGAENIGDLIGYNNITSCLNGIELDLSFHNSIFNNTISNSYNNNIYSLNSECNNIYQNNLSNAPIGILFKNSDNSNVTSNVITSNSPNSYGIVLENSSSKNSSTQKVSCTPSSSGSVIVGSIPVTSLPDINVHFNRIICPVGIKNRNYLVTVNADQNWWGSNHPVFTNLVSGSVEYPTWIYMTITSKTKHTVQGSKLSVTTNFNNLYDGKTLKNFNSMIGHIPNGTLNFFVTNIGKFEGNYAKADTTNGQAVTTYTATQLGKAVLTSKTDNQTLNSTITIDPVLKIIKLNTSFIKHGKLYYSVMKLYLNKQIKNYNNTYIEFIQVSKPNKLIGIKTSVNHNQLYITSKTAIKKGVKYKLILHSRSMGDDTGNGLSNAYVKTFKV